MEKFWLILLGGYGSGKTHLAAAIANPSASGSIRYSASVGIRRTPLLPIPRTIAAFSTEEWASAEQ